MSELICAVHRTDRVPEVGRAIQLDEAESRHLLRVRRAGPGSEVWVITGGGTGLRCRLLEPEGRTAVVEVIEAVADWREPPRRVTLAVSLVRPAHFEQVIGTGTALGMHALLPVRTERTQRQGVREERWARLAGEAAKQAGRGWIPEVRKPADLAAAIASAGEGPLLVLASDGETPLRQVPDLPDAGPITVFVGPEGDFTGPERSMLQDAGALSTHLGPRRLRTEDAAVAALSLLLV